MAQISRNSFDDTKNRKKVEYQIGQPVADNELNEAQDIANVATVETARVSFSAGYPAVYAGANAAVCYAQGNDFQATAANSPTITVAAGVLYVDGYRLVLANALDLTTAPANLSFPAVGGSDVYGFIYLELTITEVNAATDPSIATPLIGQTTVRECLVATWKKVESTVSFDSAWSSVAALGGGAGNHIWTGNTARVWLVRYHRPASSTNITNAMLLDLRQPVPAEDRSLLRFVKSFRSGSAPNAGAPELTSNLVGNPDGSGDGTVIWSAFNSTLQMGWNVNSRTGSQIGAQSGVAVRRSGAPDAVISHGVCNTGAVDGSGNADGPVALPDWTQGWTGLNDGLALGWSTQDFNGKAWNNYSLNKGNNIQTTTYDLGSEVGYSPDALIVQTLQVASLQAFAADPASFVLCTRMGADLVWWNGWITRGNNSSAAPPTFDSPGECPSEWRAVLDANGFNSNSTTSQAATFTGPDALERFMNLVSGTPGTPSSALLAVNSSTSATPPKVVRAFLRGGNYVFGRGIKRWGNAGEVFGNKGGAIVWEGEEGISALAGGSANALSTTKPVLTFNNPLSSARSATDTAVCQLQASYVKLNNLSFNMDGNVSAAFNFLAGYVLSIVADVVEIDNCEFAGPVYISAQRVVIRDCKFDYNLNNVSFVTASSGNPLTAGNLFLTTNGTSDQGAHRNPLRWLVERSLFRPCTPALVGENFNGHACVILNPEASSEPYTEGKILIVDNIFDGETYAQQLPSIHVEGVGANLTIKDNKFFGAYGIAKAGNQLLSQSLPFNGHYDGTPLFQMFGNTSSPIVATGYISMTTGRSLQSKTIIEDNSFDMSFVGTTLGIPYTFWGACFLLCNSKTLGGATGVYANVFYRRNTHVMSLDNSPGWAAQGSSYSNGQPCVWGFYASCALQDGSGVTQLSFQNIRVEENTFDLGGGDSFAGTEASAWRSIVPGNPAGWPGSSGAMSDNSLGHVTDMPVIIGFVLRNLGGVGSAYAGRSASGIVVANNEIADRVSSSGFPLNSVITVDASSWPYVDFLPIHVTSGDYFQYGNLVAASWASVVVSANGVPTIPVNNTPVVRGNVVNCLYRAFAGVYLAVDAFLGIPAYSQIYAPGILVTGAYHPSVRDNEVQVASVGGAKLSAGITVYACWEAFVSGNRVKARVGIVTAQTGNTGGTSNNYFGEADFVSDNLLVVNGPAVPIISNSVANVVYTGLAGTQGDNWV